MRTLGIIGGLVVFLLAGCTAREDEPPSAATTPPASGPRLSEHHTLGPAVVAQNLTVWPVFTDKPLEVGEFLTLREALDNGVAEVREKGSAANQRDPRVLQPPPGQREPVAPQSPEQIVFGGGATVNTLVIENRGELPILVCAGTVVKGGQQDRQIPQDVVAGAGSTIDVEAFCVEQGRWTNMRLGHATGQRFDVAIAQAAQVVRVKGQYDADQRAVWDAVGKLRMKFSERVAAANPAGPEATENLRAHQDSSSLAVAQDAAIELDGEKLDAVQRTVKAHFASFGEGGNAPVGFAYAVNGKAEGARVFAHPRIFARQFGSFLNGIAFEAYLARSGRDEGEAFPPARAEDVVALVEEIRKAEEEAKETAGMNWNGLRKGEAGFGSRCYVEAPDGGEGAKKLVITEDWTRK